jgi:hypothetical protein
MVLSVRGRFVPQPECARITSDCDRTLLARHDFVGDGITHQPYLAGPPGSQ